MTAAPARQTACPVLAAPEEIDLRNAPEFRDELRRAEDTSPFVVVDLSACAYLDSSALSVLIDAQRHRRPYGDVVIVGASDFVQRAFEITRLVKVFPMFAYVPEALAYVEGKRSREEVGAC
jgi:anti-anti-sigma factor